MHLMSYTFKYIIFGVYHVLFAIVLITKDCKCIKVSYYSKKGLFLLNASYFAQNNHWHKVFYRCCQKIFNQN